MRLEMPAWVVCIFSAAALKLPSLVAQTKASRKRTFMCGVYGQCRPRRPRLTAARGGAGPNVGPCRRRPGATGLRAHSPVTGADHVGSGRLGGLLRRAEAVEAAARVEAHDPWRDRPAGETRPAVAQAPDGRQQQHGDGQAGREDQPQAEEDEAEDESLSSALGQRLRRYSLALRERELPGRADPVGFDPDRVPSARSCRPAAACSAGSRCAAGCALERPRTEHRIEADLGHFRQRRRGHVEVQVHLRAAVPAAP